MPPKVSKPAASLEKHVVVVLLCGLPGSGKSTVRTLMVERGWAYVSQDEMGTSDACEKALVKALKAGKSCVIDRCNVTPSERRFCMQMASRAVEKGIVKGVVLHFEAVWMATPPDTCKQRAAARTGHETLSGEKASEVIDLFCRGLKIPQRSGQEPYDAVNMIRDEDDVDLIMQRYANPADINVDIAPSSEIRVTNATQEEAIQLDMSLPAELFVLRHGERADRAKGRDDGYPDDAALTKEGRETAKRAGIALRILSRSPIAVVYSSPFFRCLQTANELAGELGCPIRVEPGLAELCIAKVFSQAPQMRSPAESLARALQRTEVDLSEPPIEQSLPTWPEAPRNANMRVVNTAKALASRHPGQAICLVCHSHSLVEITRHVPKEGGGAAGSTAGYCAMSHISQSGDLQQCLDMSYLKDMSSVDIAQHTGSCIADLAAGSWEEGWSWSGEVETPDVIDVLLQLSLDEVLKAHPKFSQMFERGTKLQQDAWRQGWASPDDAMRTRLRKAHEHGLFCHSESNASSDTGTGSSNQI